MIDTLMKEIGIEGGSIGRMTDVLRDAKDIVGADPRPAWSRAGRPRRRAPTTTTTTTDAAGLRLLGDPGPGGRGLARGARVQRPARLDPLRGREPDRGRTGRGPGRLRPQLPAARRRGIRERLLALSDFDLACTYAILESPMGVTDYVATLSLIPVTDGNRTFAQWQADFLCPPEREAALVRQIGQDVFAAAFAHLRRRFGG